MVEGAVAALIRVAVENGQVVECTVDGACVIACVWVCVVGVEEKDFEEDMAWNFVSFQSVELLRKREALVMRWMRPPRWLG
jgi:hypothetical protein